MKGLDDYKNGWQSAICYILNEMKLRRLLDGDYYVLSKEQFEWLSKLYRLPKQDVGDGK